MARKKPKKLEAGAADREKLSASTDSGECADEPKGARAKIPTAGICASADGLEAYKGFFGAMPLDSGVAFVLIPHLDPHHESLMAELIGRCTAMPRIYSDKLQSIAVHAQREPGRFSTHPQHIPLEKVSPIEHGAEWLLRKARRLGTQAARWAEAMIQTRGVAGVRVLHGLLQLAKRFDSARIDRVCGIAHFGGIIG